MPATVSDDDLQFDDDLESSDVNAIELLTDDHLEVERLFQDYDNLVEDSAEASERQSLARQICALLSVHAQIEEEIFYPAAQEVLEDDDIVEEALNDHAQVKQLIADIEAAPADDKAYDDLVRKLGEAVTQHVKQEEDMLFVRVTNAGLDEQQLGSKLFDRRAELLADLEMD